MKNSKSTSRKTTTNTANHKDTSNSSGGKDQICDICAQNVPGPEREKIFAFGKCDHYVCYVCSTRLRVVCEQSDCPICREKLDSVLFTTSKGHSYDSYNLKDCLYNEKYKIYYENKSVKEAFDNLLKYECQECLRDVKKSKSTTKKNPTATNKLTTKDEQQKSNSTPESCSFRKDKPPHKKSSDGAASLNDQESDRDKTLNAPGHSNHRERRRNEFSSSPADRIEEDGQGLLKLSDIARSGFSDVCGLKTHLNYVHKLKLCDLCLTHNKLFPFEFSYYDHIALRKHMKEGEPKTSHRGHPSCGLCHNAFFNTDELLQHMSREHYHCHLCGRHDSNMRVYFRDYNNLRDHFKKEHFLCERDHCRNEALTSAFDNMIDYQLHIFQRHGNSTSGLSRGEARQQRTITLDSASHRARAISPNHSIRRDLPPNAAVVSTGTVATANSSRQQRPESIQAQVRQQRLPTRSEFPALGNAPASSTSQNALAVPGSYGNHYPSLDQTNASSTLSQRMLAGPSTSRGSFVRTAGGGIRRPEQLSEMEFPPLPEHPKPKFAKKPKAPASSRTRNDTSGLTLDQLINASLTLTSRNSGYNGKKPGSKGGSAKSNKNVKQKAIKIQLS